MLAQMNFNELWFRILTATLMTVVLVSSVPLPKESAGTNNSTMMMMEENTPVPEPVNINVTVMVLDTTLAPNPETTSPESVQRGPRESKHNNVSTINQTDGKNNSNKLKTNSIRFPEDEPEESRSPVVVSSSTEKPEAVSEMDLKNSSEPSPMTTSSPQKLDGKIEETVRQGKASSIPSPSSTSPANLPSSSTESSPSSMEVTSKEDTSSSAESKESSEEDVAMTTGSSAESSENSGEDHSESSSPSSTSSSTRQGKAQNDEDDLSGSSLNETTTISSMVKGDAEIPAASEDEKTRKVRVFMPKTFYSDDEMSHDGDKSLLQDPINVGLVQESSFSPKEKVESTTLSAELGSINSTVTPMEKMEKINGTASMVEMM